MCLRVIVKNGNGEGPGNRGCGDMKIGSDGKSELGLSRYVRNLSVILHFMSFYQLIL